MSVEAISNNFLHLNILLVHPATLQFPVRQQIKVLIVCMTEFFSIAILTHFKLSVYLL